MKYKNPVFFQGIVIIFFFNEEKAQNTGKKAHNFNECTIATSMK